MTEYDVKKLSLVCTHLSDSSGLKDFTYIAFKGLLCGNFVDLAIHLLNEHHLKLSTHHRILGKLSFGLIHYRKVSLPVVPNNLPASLMLLNF